MIIKEYIKYAVQKLTGDTIWATRATDRNSVTSLIRSLQPRMSVAPLVRVGPRGDGGYLIPDDLDGVAACISPGVSVQTGFDEAIAERGINVHMADGSVTGPPISNPRFHFLKKFIDVFEDEHNTRLETICRIVPKDKGDLILQMDIEGAEWRVLLDLDADTMARFRIMVIEFHYLQQMFSGFPYQIMSATFKKILRSHSVVHIHANNFCQPISFGGAVVPPLLEVTFYRNDRSFKEERSRSCHHPLDENNVASNSPAILPDYWYY